MIRTQARQIGDDFNLLQGLRRRSPGRIYDVVAFNNDGSRFAVGSSLDGTGEVRIYETDSAKLLAQAAANKAIFAVSVFDQRQDSGCGRVRRHGMTIRR